MRPVPQHPEIRNVNERELLVVRPVMFRNHPVAFVLCVILIPVGIGAIALLIWWLDKLGTTLIVTDRRTTLRRGILSKSTNEVLHEHIRNIQIVQGMFQRLMGVGRISLSSSGQSDVEITVAGIPDPEGVKRVIDAHRFQARD